MDIFNNTTKVVMDYLEEKITSGSRISIVVACFSIYTFQELKIPTFICLYAHEQLHHRGYGCERGKNLTNMVSRM